MNSKIIYTRKQLWRRCKISSTYKNFEDRENFEEVEGIMLVNKNNDILYKFNLKKVRFSNIAHLTLIPTRKELDDLDRYYNSHRNFLNLKEK